ncbi:unnamed protein product [Aureobasidium mustum]|uniref:WSC domain-containing protein n=1 Tax=Aureobasidium mustum TaxID=2773714 RepID=A0A9N8PGF2_9PEZI|nr:unnamed protein product [Aureobasidium mustum]
MLVATIVSALSLFAVASAQSTSTSASASATRSVVASAAPGTNGYDYIGCYNETTGIAGTSGARAITGGKMDTGDNTTVADCLQYCGQNSYQYAGLEYSKECWCGSYLSALSDKLPESNCSLACVGNDSELCGGFLTISLYNLTSKKAGSDDSSSSTKGAATSVSASSWTYVIGAGVMALTLGAAL